MTDKIVRIGGASGFWGDSAMSAPQLLYRDDIDYLVFDYLAEVTMSIMARMRDRDPQSGYAVDFVSVVMRRLIRDIVDKGVKVVSNAGGVNPRACAAALAAVAREAGVMPKIAVVLGDDLIDRADALRQAGTREMFSGEPFPDDVKSINAYFGALPIKQALDDGADIVITGRCVDSAVTLGPLMHEFGWGADDYDRLAAGSLAGHILECGAQATGGLFTDWDTVPDWDDIGYPVAECAADGSFVVAKPPGTGGIVTVPVVAEQMLYEIGDPQRYMLPDVVCDFTDVRMEQVGENRVRVSGARGYAPTGAYKVSATYQDGYRSTMALTIGGIDADAKARKTADAILKRTRRMFADMNLGDYKDTCVEIVGAEAMYGDKARVRAPREVVMRLSVSHQDKRAIGLFAREATSPGTSMSPGTTGFFGGRPKPSPIVRLFSFLISKADVPATVLSGEIENAVDIPSADGFADVEIVPPVPDDGPVVPTGPTVTVPLVRLAHGRSGDKGNSSNIGIIARKPEYLPLLRAALTSEAVAEYMAHVLEETSRVERFEVPGIDAINFLLHGALGGGGMATLRNDSLGKAYAQMLLDFPVEAPAAWGLAAEGGQAAA
ncbi:MAG: DUF1446 domain-containing protein [Minwuiales bacterium]|nr:DUF1446 domain-containing protein [Minwuiales bacterium]